MRFQKQKMDECVLASICMLYGKDYRYQSKKFNHLYRRSFGDAVWDAPAECNDFLRALTGSTISVFTLYSDYVESGKPINLKGRGWITFDNGCNKHRTAYENGVIYDALESKPLPLKEWQKRNINFEVLAVHPIGRK